MTQTTDRECVFCAIVAGDAPATITQQWPDAIAILPKGGGATPGHTLVIPRVHVNDIGDDPIVSAATVARAAELVAALPHANLITSKGSVATQTVFHLHVHVLPRRDGDNLALPWTATTPGPVSA